jgi:putative membrane protein
MSHGPAPTPTGRRWYETGSEPDYRFSLANERTFLAWVRTSLGLMAAAVAVSQLLPDADLPGLRRAIGLILGALGLGASALAYTSWARREQAMRTDAALPRSPLLPIVGVALTLVAVLALVLVVFTDE